MVNITYYSIHGVYKPTFRCLSKFDVKSAVFPSVFIEWTRQVDHLLQTEAEVLSRETRFEAEKVKHDAKRRVRTPAGSRGVVVVKHGEVPWHEPWSHGGFLMTFKCLNFIIFLNLVGGLEHFLWLSIYYWECHHPNWLSYFFRGVGIPPTSNGERYD